MLRSLASLLVLAPLAVAHAEPFVVVDRDVQLAPDQLRRAIELRIQREASVYIGRETGNWLIIDVDGHRQLVEVDRDDPDTTVRLVAMIAHALSVERRPVRTPLPPAATAQVDATPSPAATPKSRNLALRVAPQMALDDGGYSFALMTWSVGYRLSPHTRLVGTLGLGNHEALYAEELIVPARLGIEGIAGAAGVELGVTGTQHFTSCGSEQTGGVYGAARVYVPVMKNVQLVFEGGGSLVLDRSDDGEYTTSGYGYGSGTLGSSSAGGSTTWTETRTMCFGAHAWQSYMGWLGAGLEWAL